MTITDLARRHAAQYLSTGQLPVDDGHPLVRAFQSLLDERDAENEGAMDILRQAAPDIGKATRQRDLLLEYTRSMAALDYADTGTMCAAAKQCLAECEKGKIDE